MLNKLDDITLIVGIIKVRKGKDILCRKIQEVEKNGRRGI